MRRNALWVVPLVAACGGTETDEPVTPPAAPLRGAASLCAPAIPEPYPAPDAFEPNAGPGTAATFEAAQMMTGCAFLDGGDLDVSDHHNLLTMYDGYLLMPWAPEWAGGGLTLWDVSQPCSPQMVGTGFSEYMRETHAIGFSDLGGRWAVVNGLRGFNEGGAQFWDLSDPTAPEPVSEVLVDGFGYPDAYARVSLSVFWQAPYVFIATADNGIYVVDATDPRDPFVVGQATFDPVLRAGQVQAVGDLLVVTEAEGPRTVLLDISDPEEPQPIGGGDFLLVDGEGTPREAYFSNLEGGYVYYARKSMGGGVMMMDIHDPSAPSYAGDIRSDGNGGYVFVKEGVAFVGEGSFAAAYDVSDPSDIQVITQDFTLEGDLDTITPIANFVVLSVDDEANEDQGSQIVPFAEAPDTRPPEVTWVWPTDGAQDLARGSRIGVTFSEMVDVKSAFEGSVRLYDAALGPDEGRIPAVISTQENIVNLVPRCPLTPGATYTFEIPAGGVRDFGGNAIAETFRATFTVAGG